MNFRRNPATGRIICNAVRTKLPKNGTGSVRVVHWVDYILSRRENDLMKKTASLFCTLILGAGVAVAADDKASAKGDVAKGKEVFEQCGACHDTETGEKKMGPSLKGLSTRKKLASGKAVTDANLKAVINQGGNGMPGYADLLTDEEKAHVLAYIKTL